MINYNNNNQQQTFQDTPHILTEKKIQQETSIFQEIQPEKFLDREKKQRKEDLSNKQTLNIIKKEREWEDLNQVDFKKQKLQTGQKQILIKEELKATVHYQKNKKVEGQTPQNRVTSKLSFIINAAAQGNQEITVSNCSQISLRQSNNSSGASSIHSNDRNWRKQFYKEVETNQSSNKQRVHHEKTAKSKKKIFFHDEKLENQGRNAYKYLFYQQSSQNSQAEAKPQLSNKKVQIQRVQTPVKILKNQQKKLKQQLNQQIKIKYIYKKGKYTEGQSKQQRVKNKIGFLLDHLEKSSQIISVSCNSQKNSLEASQFKNLVQKENPKEAQEHMVQRIQNAVIFAQNKKEIQHDHSELKEKPQDQQIVVQRPIFEELQIRRQQEERSQVVAITPKQTIDLDKSFKSINSKLTPKSKVLSQSLDKSNNSKSKTKGRVIYHRAPSTAKQRKNSLEQFNQIIADIQKKSQEYKSAVDNSVGSKNKSQVDNQSISAQNHKKFSVKSDRKNSFVVKNQSSSQEMYKKTNEQDKNIIVDKQQTISKESQISQFEAEIEQVQLKKTPVSIIIKDENTEKLFDNLNSKFERIPQLKSQKKQNGSMVSKQELSKGSNAYNQNKIKQYIVSSNARKKSHQFNEQAQALKDKPIVKEIKQIKHPKAGYLKTLLKEDIDESDLITQLLPKNKIQFKVDLSRRLKTQIGSAAVQNKKFQALLKRRQNVLVKKAKQQTKIDPRSFLFPESSSGGISKQSSMKSNDHTFSDTKFQTLTARNVLGESKTKMMTNIGFKRDSINVQKTFLPLLTARTQHVREEQRNIKVNSITLKKQIDESLAQHRSNYDSLFERRLAFKEQTQKILQRNPSVKIEFHGLSRNKVNENSPHKKLQVKQKYERLRQLLASQ